MSAVRASWRNEALVNRPPNQALQLTRSRSERLAGRGCWRDHPCSATCGAVLQLRQAVGR
jgi:hypothetical protein